MDVPQSRELQELYLQAQDIASQLEQEMNSSHLLLPLFLLPNKAEEMLKERGIDEDRILSELTGQDEELPGVMEHIAQKMEQFAQSSHAQMLDTLHLLLAMSRVSQSLAYQLLQRCHVSLPKLRNQAMSYLTGRVRRRFDSICDDEGAVEVVHASEQLARMGRPIPKQKETKTLSDKTWELLAQGELDAEAFPWLSSLGRNLTRLAHKGKIDPLVGREKELDEIIDILGKRRANNPCLIGEPGVGKTALVEGLALAIAHMNIPGLSGKLLLELDMGSLLAGTQLRGSLAEKLQGIKEEVKSAKGQIIVFIDEVHTLVRAGATGESAQDASNDLKTALSRGEFPCVGATTIQDYKTYIETDPALVRRFHTIWIEEPSQDETMRILDGVAPAYARHHKVHYLPEALFAACRLSARYLHERRLPAKAIDILDLAGSRARRARKKHVGRVEVTQVIAKLAAIPEEYLLVEDRKRLLSLESTLAQQVVGHRDILADISSVVRRNYAGFKGPRPIGSFLFLGPTGVGKTETAKAIAHHLFHQAHSFVRIDMSEYQDSASVTRLIGAPPGYIGHDDGGQLTEAVRTRPYQLVLLDEIDKAHRDVLLILLQLLDEGHLTDGKGRKVSFSNCVIVMTSNLGSDCFSLSGRSSIGFNKSEPSEHELNEVVLSVASKQMPIELWNRIDARLVFMPLKREEIRELARLMIKSSAEKICEEKDIAYTASEPVIDWLIEHGGYHPELGARPMRTMIRRYLEAALAEQILMEEVGPGARLHAALDTKNQIVFRPVSAPVAKSPTQTTSHTANVPVEQTSKGRKVLRPLPPQVAPPQQEENVVDEFDILALPLN